MGGLKEKMMENEERKRDALLAKILGISLSELDETNWEIIEIENNDGLVTDVLVKFGNSPKGILDKIGVEEGSNTYSIGDSALENAAFSYKRYSEILKISYSELLFSETEESDIIEKDGEMGIYLKFKDDTPYELLAKVKHNGLTESYETWLPID